MGYLINIFSAFIIGFFACIVATGPVTFLVFKNSFLGRYRKASSMIIGASIMEAIYCNLALTLVSTLFFQIRNIRSFSKLASIVIFLSIGIHLITTKIDKEKKYKIKPITKGENTKSFLTGFILVALNPSIILIWSAILTALISFNIIVIRNAFHIASFVISAGLGMMAGGLSMILLTRYFKMKFSQNFLNNLLKFIGIVLIIASLYTLASVKSII